MLQIKIFTEGKHAEAISELLLAADAQAVTFLDAADQPLFQLQPNEIHLWQRMIVMAIFPDEVSIKKFLPTLSTLFPNLQYQIEALPEQNWVEKTQRDFKPLHFGKRLWVCPPWDLIEQPNTLVVTLNPGVAFGTGTHPTTALCLEWLEKNIQGGETVIDYGCGSGILAIAALKLGAQAVWAIDHDPQALEATRANAELNSISADQLHILEPDALNNVTADLLIANILALPLLELAEKFKNLLKKRGRFAISGILREQINEIIPVYQKWFTVLPPCYKEEWALLEGSQNAPK